MNQRVKLIFLILLIPLFLFIVLQKIEINQTGELFLIPKGYFGILVFIVFILVLVLYTSKDQYREDESNFAREFLNSLFNKDEKLSLSVIERCKEKSLVARTLSSEKIDRYSVVRELKIQYGQVKVRNFLRYKIDIGKGHEAIGTVLRHMIEHKKLKPVQGRYLEEELGGLMPKRDYIGELYEKT